MVDGLARIITAKLSFAAKYTGLIYLASSFNAKAHSVPAFPRRASAPKYNV